MRVPSPKAVLGRPQRVVLVLVALSPYHGLLQIVPHPFIVQGWKEALIGLAVIASFVAGVDVRGAVDRRVPSWAGGLAAFAAVGLAWAAVRHDVAALYGLKIYFFSALLAVVVWRCPFNAVERDRFVSIVMVNGIVTGAIGIAQQIVGHKALNDLGYGYNTTIRFTGHYLRSFSTFDGPFAFGFFEMAVLVICVPVAIAERARWRNRLFVLASPLVVAGMLTTFVRGAWLGAAAGLTVVAVRRLRPTVVLAVAVTAAVVTIGLVLLAPRAVVERATQSSSGHDRLSLWHDNIDQILDRPFGHGIGTTGATSEKLNVLGLRRGPTFQPDNHFFLVAYELGWEGLLCFSAFLVALAWEIHRATGRLAPRDSALAFGIQGLTVAALAASTVASYFHVFPNDVLLWVGVTAVCASADAQPQRRPQHRRATYRAIASR